MNRWLAPSLLSADFARLADEIRQVETAGVELLHVDVMDGHFVPNLTIGAPVVASLRRVTRLPLDVHLMVSQPDSLIPAFVDAGADWISVHAEACTHLHRTVWQIKKAGRRAGVALNPATPLQCIEPILEDLDFVLLMTVNPGFGGQSFISSVLRKIERLRRWLDERGLATRLEVDGGIHRETIVPAAQSGADVFVAGNAIFGEKDRTIAIQDLRNAIEPVILRAPFGA